MPASANFHQYNIAAVIPAYRVERDIESVLRELPEYLRQIIVVDDASPDKTSALVKALARRDKRIVLIRHAQNQGVGGAMITGFQKSLELGAQIIVKVDGDGQMDTSRLPALLTPLIEGKADYVKGNRFRDFGPLKQMPFVRRVGNLGLSFLTKAATGYWNCFDPTNGFFAIRAEALAQLPLDRIDHSYYFETSMLSYLYLLDACVLDVPIPARYRGEISSMSIRRVLFEFPYKLTRTFWRRIVLKYFIYDFSMMSVYLRVGIPLLLFGLIFGITKWIQYAELGVAAPTGTVILPTLSVILAIQILLSAIEIDVNAAPRKPISVSHLSKRNETQR
ncbi:MAG: glycosyltransferase family 2 protein [Anaerolineales bacterium]|nr:glycosyltransferase family 2 protein [Anaerolineales bacterium]